MRTPRHSRDPDSIRPSLWMASLGCVLAALWGVTWTVEHAGSAEANEDGPTATAAAGPRRLSLTPVPEEDGLVRSARDPGGRGSVREAWAESARQGDADTEVWASPEGSRDPQASRARLSFRGEGVIAPFERTAQRGRLSEVRGLALPPGAACDVRVLPVESGPYNCLVRVMCGEVVVYPDDAQEAGYMTCELEGGRPVRGRDLGMSGGDGDPALSFDLATGTVAVQDDRPERSVTLQLDPGLGGAG